MKWIQSRPDVVKNSLAVFVVLLVSVVGVKLLTASHAATGAVLSLSAPSTSLTPGSTVAVTIKEDSGTDPVNSVQAAVNYDATQLQYVSFTEGTAFPTVAANSTATAGVIRVGRATSTPVTGSNNVVTVNFKVLSSTGTTSLSFDKAYSFVVRSTDNTDVLATTTPSTYTVGTSTSTGATMSLSPASGSAAKDSIVNVTINEDSGTTAVNSVQASLGYDPAAFQYVSISEGGKFATVAATDTATAGRVRVARSTTAGAAGVTGSNGIVTVSFKVLTGTGTSSFTLDKTQSFVVNSSTNADVLGTVTGSSYTLTGTASSGKATLSMTPSTGSYAIGSTVAVTVKATSPTALVTTVQSTINYPAAQLQYVSTTEGTAFTTAQRTNTSTAGVVDIIRSIPGGNGGLTGTNTVVTLNFKVIGSGTAALTYGSTSAIYDDTGTGINILDTAGSTAASYTTTGTSTASSATLSMTPASGSYAKDSTLSVTIKATSAAALTTVEAAINYPASQLSFMSATEGNVFTTQQRTNTATAGTIDIIRSLPGGNAGVTGTNSVITLNFKVLGSTGSAALTYGSASAVFDDSGTGTSILNVSGSTAASYTLTGGSTTGGSATMSLSPATGTAAVGSTINVAVRESSGLSSVNAVQSAVAYDSTKLQYTGIAEGGVFTNVAATDTATAGTVRLARSVQSGSTGVSGDNLIATLTFKVLGSSGTTALSLTKAQSFVVDSGSNSDILGTVSGSSYTLTATQPAGNATFSMTPASGSYATGSTISVVVKATSTAALTTAELALTYPAAQLQYVNTTEGTVFTTAQRTNTATAGTIDIIRSIPGGNAGVTGTNPVVTINFKVLGSSGTAALAYTTAAALYDDSGTGNNILNSANSSAASYTMTTPTSSCTANPSTPGVATRTSNTYTSITLSWTASTAGTNCTLSGYHVYRDGTLVGDATTGTSFTDTGLTSGTAYSYTVKAFDTSAHTSAASPAASLSAKADDQAPTTPAGVTAAATGPTNVNVAWNPSTDFPNPGGVGVAGYHIYRNGAATPTYTVTSGTTYADANVTSNTTYTYTVAAYDKLNNESAPSSILTVKTPVIASCGSAPTVPTALTTTGTTVDTASFSWTASTAGSGCTLSGYRIYRNGTFVGTSTTATYRDTGLTPGTTYSYTVQSYDAAGNVSAASAAKSITTTADTTAPTAPATFTATAISAGQVGLSWTAGTDNVAVTGYKIYRGGTLIKTTSGAGLTYSDTTVAGNTDYAYTISAIDATGNESAKKAATPSPVHTPSAADTTAPTVPASLKTLAIATNSVSLSWTASTDNVGVSGYHVYRGTTLVGDAATTTYLDSNLTANTLYIYTVKAFDAAGNTSAASSALNVTTSQVASCITADLNCDKVVDIYDLSIMMTHFGEINVPVKFGDIDQDGTVNIFDLSTLLSHLGDKG